MIDNRFSDGYNPYIRGDKSPENRLRYRNYHTLTVKQNVSLHRLCDIMRRQYKYYDTCFDSFQREFVTYLS